jgi:steroid delta-isomerase-like uncharacterized protein
MATETETTDSAQAGGAAAPVEPKPQRRRTPRRKVVEAHARSYFDALARRDARSMADHWREDGVDDLVPLGPLRGRAEIAAFFRDLFAALPDVETTVTRVVAGEREAAVEWRMRGSFTGAPFQGIDPTGRAVELRGIDLLEVEEGEIVGNTAFYDAMDFARQIGMMPPRDSGAERAMKSALNAATRVRRAVADRRAAR